MQIEYLKKEIEEITGLKVFEIKITNPSQFNMFLKMREKGLMKNNIYIAKSNTFLELCYKANRDFIIYHKLSCLQISTMEKSARELIKNMGQSIINECGICFQTDCELNGCMTCVAQICEPCLKKSLNDYHELYCPFCRCFLLKLEL